MDADGGVAGSLGWQGPGDRKGRDGVNPSSTLRRVNALGASCIPLCRHGACPHATLAVAGTLSQNAPLSSRLGERQAPFLRSRSHTGGNAYATLSSPGGDPTKTAYAVS
jgi:hypothetical protein